MSELEKIDNDTEDTEDEEEGYDDGVGPLKGKNLIVMIAVAIALAIGIYFFIFGGPKPKEVAPEKTTITTEEGDRNTIARSVPETDTNVSFEEINTFRDELDNRTNSQKSNPTEEFESLFYEPDLPEVPELENINLDNNALNLPDISEIEKRLAEQRLQQEEERRAREEEEARKLEQARAEEARKNAAMPVIPALPALPPITDTATKPVEPPQPEPEVETTPEEIPRAEEEPPAPYPAEDRFMAERQPERKVPVAEVEVPTPSTAPAPTPAAPTTPGLNSLTSTEAARNAQRQQALAARRQITSVVMTGAAPTGLQEEERGIVLRKVDNVSSLPAITTNFSASRIDDLSTTLLQGKIIHVVLETALNTDLPGTLRAIVSRDVYAELGENILIPKGSRMIGSYAATVARGQSRIAISWTRIIRPDGVSITIDSQAADQFGRAGLEGDINNRYKEIIANAVLSSFLSVGTVIMAELLTDTDGIVETEVDGTTKLNSGMASDYTLQRLGNDLVTTTQELLQGSIQTTPTITVPQGTRITVFVNQDLRVPPMTANKIAN